MDLKFKNLFAFDLDGTLVHKLPDGKRGVPPELLYEIHRISQNAHVLVATGRRYKAALADVQSLPPMSYVVVHNGLVIKNHLAETVFSANLRRELALEIAKIVEDHGFFPFFVSDGHRFRFDYAYTRKALEASPMIQSLRTRPQQQSIVLESIEDIVGHEDVPLLEVAALGPFEALKEFETSLDEFLPPGLKSVLVQNIGYSNFSVIEIFEEQYSKWSAIQWIKKVISAERVIAVGDDGNDREMIEFADIGVAMSHAQDEIRRLSQVQVDGASGLAKFLREFSL